MALFPKLQDTSVVCVWFNSSNMENNYGRPLNIIEANWSSRSIIFRAVLQVAPSYWNQSLSASSMFISRWHITRHNRARHFIAVGIPLSCSKGKGRVTNRMQHHTVTLLSETHILKLSELSDEISLFTIITIQLKINMVWLNEWLLSPNRRSNRPYGGPGSFVVE